MLCKSDPTNSEGQVKYCRCTFFGHATPDRAGARPYRVQCRVARCSMGIPAQTSHPLSRLFACFAGPFLGNQVLDQCFFTALPETHPVQSIQKSGDMLTKSIKEVLWKIV